MSKTLIVVYTVAGLLNLVSFVWGPHAIDKLTLALLFGALIVYQISFNRMVEIARGYDRVCESYRKTVAIYQKMLHD